MMAALPLQTKTVWQEPASVNRVRVNLASGKIAFGRDGRVVPVVSGTEPGAPYARNALGLQSLQDAYGTNALGVEGAEGGQGSGDGEGTLGADGSLPGSDSNDLRGLQ